MFTLAKGLRRGGKIRRRRAFGTSAAKGTGPPVVAVFVAIFLLASPATFLGLVLVGFPAALLMVGLGALLLPTIIGAPFGIGLI